jgi:hypothetical protein
MKEVKGSVDIDAPVARVWEAVTDFASYPEWNPFIVEIVGELRTGYVFNVVVRAPGRKDMRFPSTVMEIREKEKLDFHGVPKKGLVSSKHLFILEPAGPDRTRFSQSIAFSGVMVPLAGGVIKDAQEGLDRMNEALKARCEGK